MAKIKVTQIPVVYRWIEGEVLAVFPTFDTSRPWNLAAYAHVGQHCEIDQNYYSYGSGGYSGWPSGKASRLATIDEYKDLHKELTGIYNEEFDGGRIELRICKKLNAKNRTVSVSSDTIKV